MIAVLLQQAAERPAFSIWGIIIPAAIFIVAFLMTLALYRHFSGVQAADAAAAASAEAEEAAAAADSEKGRDEPPAR